MFLCFAVFTEDKLWKSFQNKLVPGYLQTKQSWTGCQQRFGISQDKPLCIILILTVSLGERCHVEYHYINTVSLRKTELRSNLHHIKVKNVWFYIAQYLVRWTTQSVLQTCSFRHQLDFSGKHSSHATAPNSQVLIYTAEWNSAGKNENAQASKQQQTGF